MKEMPVRQSHKFQEVMPPVIFTIVSLNPRNILTNIVMQIEKQTEKVKRWSRSSFGIKTKDKRNPGTKSVNKNPSRACTILNTPSKIVRSNIPIKPKPGL